MWVLESARRDPMFLKQAPHSNHENDMLDFWVLSFKEPEYNSGIRLAEGENCELLNISFKNSQILLGSGEDIA